MLYLDYLKRTHPCPFCARPDRVVKTARSAYLTYSLAPYARYHLLIVPKRHVESVSGLTAQEFKDMVSLMRVVMCIYAKKRIKDFSFLLRNGKNSGRSVRHVHMNVVPHHRLGDVDQNSDKRKILSEKRVAQLVQELRKLAS